MSHRRRFSIAVCLHFQSEQRELFDAESFLGLCIRNRFRRASLPGAKRRRRYTCDSIASPDCGSAYARCSSSTESRHSAEPGCDSGNELSPAAGSISSADGGTTACRPGHQRIAKLVRRQKPGEARIDFSPRLPVVSQRASDRRFAIAHWIHREMVWSMPEDGPHPE